MRAFFAADPDPAARRAVAERMAVLAERPGAQSVRWVREESLHVTLRFLGEIEESSVPALALAVRESVSGVAPFGLQLGAVHPFPTPRRPRVVAMDLHPEPPLAALARAVERGARRAVDARRGTNEERPFRAHLTLGRVRRGARGFPDVAGLDAPLGAGFEVSEVVLFESRLSQEGARYTALERIPLGGAT